MARKYSNTSVETTLVGSIDSGDTSIALNDTGGLPASFPYTLILDFEGSSVEVVTVTNATGGTLTVTRGQDGTAAQSHDAGTTVVHGVTARDLSEPQVHIDDTDDAHGVGSGNTIVGTGTTQTLTNKTISGNNNTITNLDGDSLVGTFDASSVNSTWDTLTAASLTLTDPDPDLDVGNAVVGLLSDVSDLEDAVDDLTGFRAPEVFESSGTWTNPDDGFKAVEVEGVAGGGAGGGSVATDGSTRSAGQGGAAGGYFRKVIPAAQLGGTETVTIGAGGTGTSGDSGGNGSATSFGSHCSANGGPGGDVSTGSGGSGTSGPDGGTATGGDINIRGGAGGYTIRSSAIVAGGEGGHSMLGTGGSYATAGNSGFNGKTGVGYGSGGSGTASHENQSARTGNDGQPGIVIVRYIY